MKIVRNIKGRVMSFKIHLKDALRPWRDISYAVGGFMYDFARFWRHGGWRHHGRRSVRDYKAVKIYHRLEKSLSFRERRADSGLAAAQELVRHLDRSAATPAAWTFHEKVGVKVLGEYIAASDPLVGAPGIVTFHEKHAADAPDFGGAVEVTATSLQKGRLDDPEAFFNSRASVRDFAPVGVPLADIERAVTLALKTPSVCNRQASHVYCLHRREDIDRALSLQNGNRGFGHEIPCLLVICADLTAFDTAAERYQHWIDGGMFSMSIVWALHALGYASCCLNWSKTPGDDRRIRSLLPIRPEHSIMMMLAVGQPNDRIRACYSARKPVPEFLEIIN